MNLYEAIFSRKSVRSYLQDAISPDVLGDIDTYYRDLPNLFGAMQTDIEIFDSRKHSLRLMHVGAVKAPYYLIFYSEEMPRYQMNIGYLMEQMALYLCTLGFGTCFIGSTNIRRDLQEKNGLKIVGLMAFGKAKGSAVRKASEARRLPLEALCVFKDKPHQWMMQLLEAARLAPSAMNAQPWRFVVCESRIHIFTKKHQADHLNKYRWEEVDFGILFANILIAAEELWIDVDLIRLENLTQKNFPNSQYVLSAVMKS